MAWTRKLFSPELGEFFDYKDGAFARETDSEGWTPLYTTPPLRKPLTDEQYEAIVEDLAEWSRYVETDTAHQTRRATRSPSVSRSPN